MLVQYLKTISALVTCSICYFSVVAQDKIQNSQVEDTKLQWRKDIQNEDLRYVYYDQIISDVAVLDASYIELYDAKTNKLLRIFDRTLKDRTICDIEFGSKEAEILKLFPDARVSIKNKWKLIEEVLHPVNLVYVEYDSISLQGIYDIATEDFIFLNENKCHLNDSTVHVKIFNPDPLTSAHEIYGTSITDLNDASYPDIMDETQWMELKTDYDPSVDSFLNQTDFILLEDLENPVNDVSYHLGDTTEVNRSSSRFEDLMILTHIGKYQDWIADLGVTGLQNFKLKADGWGLFGADNSVFRSFAPPRLSEISFGTGGVDDAEDADVIIHEYTHGLVFNATGIHVSLFSLQTKALGEGLCDLAAACYSYKIDTFGWERVYSWDGHNEYWPGRVTNSTNTLPTSSTNIYYIGEILNSALFEVARERDVDSTMRLVLNGLFLIDANTDLPEFAQIILDLDTSLYGGAMSDALCSSFDDRGILSNCDSLSAIASVSAPDYTLINSQGFAAGVSALTIRLSEVAKTVRARIVNPLGQSLEILEFKNTSELKIPPRFQSGIYYLNLDDGKSNWTIPLHVH